MGEIHSSRGKNVDGLSASLSSGDLRPSSKPSLFAYVKTANISVSSSSE